MSIYTFDLGSLTVEVDYTFIKGYEGNMYGPPGDANPPQSADIEINNYQIYDEDGNEIDEEVLDEDTQMQLNNFLNSEALYVAIAEDHEEEQADLEAAYWDDRLDQMRDERFERELNSNSKNKMIKKVAQNLKDNNLKQPFKISEVYIKLKK